MALKALAGQHHLTVIFSPWSYDITYFLCVRLELLPVCLQPHKGGGACLGPVHD